MGIKTWIIGSGLLCVSIGTVIISTSINGAIDDFAVVQRSRAEVRLAQEKSEWQREERIRDATLQAKIDFQNALLYNLKYVGITAITITVGAGLWLVIGYTQAETKKAQFEATQIKMDPVTKTFPMIVFEGSNGKLRLHDPNTHMTKALDADHEVVPLLAMNGLMAQLQHKARDNQEVNVPRLIDFAANYIKETSSG